MRLMDLRVFPKGVESREHILVECKNTSLLSSVKITFCCLVRANRAGPTQRLLARSTPEHSPHLTARQGLPDPLGDGKQAGGTRRRALPSGASAPCSMHAARKRVSQATPASRDSPN